MIRTVVRYRCHLDGAEVKLTPGRKEGGCYGITPGDNISHPPREKKIEPDCFSLDSGKGANTPSDVSRLAPTPTRPKPTTINNTTTNRSWNWSYHPGCTYVTPN